MPANKCLNCRRAFENKKINICCGRYKWSKCCKQPLEATPENIDKYPDLYKKIQKKEKK